MNQLETLPGTASQPRRADCPRMGVQVQHPWLPVPGVGRGFITEATKCHRIRIPPGSLKPREMELLVEELLSQLPRMCCRHRAHEWGAHPAPGQEAARPPPPKAQTGGILQCCSQLDAVQ